MSLRQRIIARLNHMAWIRGRISMAPAIVMRRGEAWLPSFGSGAQEGSGSTAFLEGLSWEGLTVYDVGGDPEPDAVFFAQRVGESGCVVVFEPSRRHCERIESQMAAQGFRNVRVVPVGLGERRETVEFAVPSWDVSRGTAIGSIATRARGDVGVEISRVEINSLDDEILCTGLPAPHFIKLDIEGMEYPALRGMQETIRTHQPRLFIEMHRSVSLEERTGDERGIAALLENQGYRLRRIEQENGVPAGAAGRGSGGCYYCEPVPGRVTIGGARWA